MFRGPPCQTKNLVDAESTHLGGLKKSPRRLCHNRVKERRAAGILATFMTGKLSISPDLRRLVAAKGGQPGGQDGDSDKTGQNMGRNRAVQKCRPIPISCRMFNVAFLERKQFCRLGVAVVV
nr:hypothetical protein [uncultured Roseovarius sp.]